MRKIVTNKKIETNNERMYEFNTDLNNIYGMGFESSYSMNNISPLTVKRWLKNPMQYNKELRDLAKQLYSSNGIYTNVVDYIIALPTLDRVVYGNNKSHSRFKNNKEKFTDILNIINDKTVIRDYLLSLALNGVYFAYFDVKSNKKQDEDFLTDNDMKNVTEINSEYNASVTTLPIDYCKIYDIKNNSYRIAFNLKYFDVYKSNGLSKKIKKFPKEIIDGYKRYIKNPSKNWIVLDNNKTIVSKVRAMKSEPWGRPLGIASFLDMLYDEYFTDTKRNVLDDINNTIIYQTFPEGEKKGTCSLTQKQQQSQHNNVKSALFARNNVKGISFFSIASGTKLDKIKTDVDVLKDEIGQDLIKRISTELGFASSLLNGQDGNFSSQESNLDMISARIFEWVEKFVEEINKVINLNVIKDKKCPIKVYYLPITHANRKEKYNQAKELYTLGRGSLTAWIASSGWDTDAYISLMEYESEEKWDEIFPVHPTSYTLSGNNQDGVKDIGDNKAGRSEDDNPTNENTIKSKTNDSSNTSKPSLR